MLKSFSDHFLFSFWPRNQKNSNASHRLRSVKNEPNHLTLTNLPVDVIRTIVDVDEGPGDSLLSMRLVSF